MQIPNCRICGSENLKMIIEKPLCPQTVIVWCGFWAGGIIGPYFFENEAGAAVLVNGLRYRTKLEIGSQMCESVMENFIKT